MKEDKDGSAANRVLSSWKEIARYLDRGIRTVQRWERDLQLPVHRVGAKKRAAVRAYCKDIDAWLSRCPRSVLDDEERK